MGLNMNKIDYLKDQTKKDFELLKKWTNTAVLTEIECLENLEVILQSKIQKLIESNINELMDILYRTDVGETNVRNAFSANLDSKDVAHNIAKLYLQRLIEKWKTRQAYQNPDIQGDW